MKKIVSLACLFLTLTSFQSRFEPQITNAEIEAFVGIEDFLKDFEKAVLKEGPSEILTFFDGEYKEEQHDRNLKGRTEQFLNEFFGGKRADNNSWANIKYKDIKKMKCLEVNVTSFEDCAVSYLITTKEFKVICNWNVTQKKELGKTVFGLVGAVG